jgi:hypothetical protein
LHIASGDAQIGKPPLNQKHCGAAR